VGGGALLLQHRIGDEQSGRFDVDDELRVCMENRHVPRQHHAELVGKDLFAGVVDHPAAVAVADPIASCRLISST
jgi:hypothetical protein